MSEFTVAINDAEEKALLTDMLSIQEWLDTAIHNKARRTIDSIIEKETDRQPKKMDVEEKHNLIRGMTLETGAEQNARLEAEAEVEHEKILAKLKEEEGV